MTLLDKLLTNGSTLSEFDGTTPTSPIGSTDQSRLHRTYSINGVPFLRSKPEPSLLDLNGKTPIKYLDTFPRR
jgi:hypothetical protein